MLERGRISLGRGMGEGCSLCQGSEARDPEAFANDCHAAKHRQVAKTETRKDGRGSHVETSTDPHNAVLLISSVVILASG